MPREHPRVRQASYVNGSVFMVCGGRLPSETMAGAPKVALDFLLRPARMTSRQHSGTKLSIRRGKLARRRQTAAAREGADMAVWFMRPLHWPFCEEFTLSRPANATRAAKPETTTKNPSRQLL